MDIKLTTWMLGALFLAQITNLRGDFEPPIGIPMPEFGIFESHHMYEGRTFEHGGFTYRDSGQGPYSHYVDNSSLHCSDDHEYGTVENPRCRLPIDLPEGSVVEIHGGPYDYYIWGSTKTVPVIGYGTKQNPVFIRGIEESRPIFELSDLGKGMSIEGSYLIIENIVVRKRMSILPFGPFRSIQNHHIAIRNNIMLGYSGYRDTAIDIGWPHGNCTNHPQYCSETLVENIVVYNNSISEFGFLDWANNYTGNSSKDSIGVYVHHNAHQTWILNNDIHLIDGDSIHLNAWGIDDDTQFPPRKTYIGYNKLHDSRENALDSKVAYDTITSQNEIYNIAVAPGSDGSCVVVQTEHQTSKYPFQENHWILYNDIHDCTGNGIRVQGVVQGAYIIGNHIHNIFSDGNPHTGSALLTWFSANPIYFINNTVADVNNGFWDHNWQPDTVSSFIVTNNIFSNVTNTSLRLSRMTSPSEPFQSNYNLYQNPVIEWKNQKFNTLGDYQIESGQGQNSLPGDPIFTNESTGDLTLLGGSLASAAGAPSTIYSLFTATYGLKINFGIQGQERPEDAWDIGAFQRTHKALPSLPSGIFVKE